MNSRRRRDGQIGYDSAFGLPEFEGTVPHPEPLSSTFRSTQESRADLQVSDNLVSVVIETPDLQATVLGALGAGRTFCVTGPDTVPDAALIIAEARANIGAQVADLRRRARPDAAILMILCSSSGEAIGQAHAAGAFACLRAPLVREELLGFMTAAHASFVARVQSADLSRKLDLESHLASIGRISAGLSHEVSSPLGAASLNMESVQRECAQLIEVLKSLVNSPPEDITRRILLTRSQIAAFESDEGLVGAIQDTIDAHERLRTLFGAMRGLVGRTHEVRREPVDLLTVVEDVRKWLVDELRGVEVEVIGSPLQALTDRMLLGQLLQNLTSNAGYAARLLSAPRIRLHVYGGSARVIVSVRDNGPGIPAEIQDRIFEPFFTTRRGKGGTGLGLSLCREYALQMRAELSVWSVPGRGACFRVNMPAAP